MLWLEGADHDGESVTACGNELHLWKRVYKGRDKSWGKKRRYDGPTAERGLVRRLDYHTGNVLCLESLGEGEFASGAEDGVVRVWNARGECTAVLGAGVVRPGE